MVKRGVALCLVLASCGGDDAGTSSRRDGGGAEPDAGATMDASVPPTDGRGSSADASSVPDSSTPVGEASMADQTHNDRAPSDVTDAVAVDSSVRDAITRSDGEAGTTTPPALDAGFDAPDFGGSDAVSNGGTITFETIGAAGWYPSRRDPASGQCDAFQSSTCCMAKANITSDALTPWDEDLIVSLRGPMDVKQMAVYQPDPSSGAWNLVSAWDAASPSAPRGLAFDGNNTEKNGFPGTVGTECIVNVSTSDVFACGAGSTPFCPPAAGKQMHRGWTGSKLFVVLAGMPHADKVPGACSTTTTGGWYDAPWIGLSVGELVRAGQFQACQCYAKDQTKSSLADGCGQFNVFEVVNDNNQYKNLDIFSTNMIGYAGYVGEGPCGPKCDVTKIGPEVDLMDKTNVREAAQGAVSNPSKGPGAAFRRPSDGLRYFLILLDVPSRTVQLALIHPRNIPGAIAPLLPSLPASVGASTVEAARSLRLPH
ncbi:MAG TPA: DUF2403 domain-containing protein [Polyangiaceae bacterium]|nr:DUF2403 domain-containing protein [Polyangiaceae bacterium]